MLEVVERCVAYFLRIGTEERMPQIATIGDCMLFIIGKWPDIPRGEKCGVLENSAKTIGHVEFVNVRKARSGVENAIRMAPLQLYEVGVLRRKVVAH